MKRYRRPIQVGNTFLTYITNLICTYLRLQSEIAIRQTEEKQDKSCQIDKLEYKEEDKKYTVTNDHA